MSRKSSSKVQRTDFEEDANVVHATAAQTPPSRVMSITDPSLNELAQQTMAGLNASAVAIAIDVDGLMTCRGRAGATAPEIGTPVQRDRGVTGECVRTGAVVRCEDALHDPRVDAAVCEQLHIGSILVVPLLRNGQAVGVVEAFFILPNSFDDVDVEFLERVAQQIVARVWGEGAAPVQTAALNEPVAPGMTVADEQSSFVTAKRNDEAPPAEAPASDPTDTTLSEPPPETPAEIDSGVKPARRGRTIAAAFAALIIIVIVIVFANWRKPAVAPIAPSPTKQAAQPAAQDPMAELRRAAEAGDTSAQYQLARAYETGSGIKADPQLANAWLRTAAEHGNPDAQLDWARAHENSDPAEAYTWYFIAGQNGKSESDDAIRRLTPKLTPADIAQVRLDIGRQYLAGHALPRDPVAAYVWFRLSQWGGNTTAITDIQQVKSQLTATQLHQGETRASEWIRRHTAPPATIPNAAAEVHH